MRDNYFSSYGRTQFIINNNRRFAKIFLSSGVAVLSIAGIFGFSSFLSHSVDAYNYVEVEEENAEVEELVVSAEEKFTEVIASGTTVSLDERSRIIRKVSSEIQSGDRRVLVLRAYLETMRCSDGSIPPLANHTLALVESADKYGLDWRYTTAISGVETWFGCAGAADSYKNAWGYGGGPATRFRYATWEEGIDAFSKGFAQGYGTHDLNFHSFASYYTRGLPGTNDRWANGVESYLYGIDKMNEEL